MTLFKKLASALIVITFTLPASAAEKLNVIASFSILGDFAQKVGGDRIELRTIVGPDSDAHVYEPKPADAIAVARADVVLVNGLLFEGFLQRLIEASGTSAEVVEVSQGAEILNDPAGGHYHYNGGKAVFHEAPLDPHAWQSVANARTYVKNIEAAFCETDAEGCPAYQANAKAYDAELDALDREIRDTLASIPQDRRVFVVAHNAFRYFEHDYGVTFLAPQGVSTDSEASAADVAGVVREIAGQRATAVFAENISNSRLVEQIASEAGLKLGGSLYSDALSKPDGKAATYIDMMRRNLATIRDAAGS
ncbi:zinc ABC transporter substrate-binding protein AztC [Aquamicrobium defluvii]|uniref:Metal ABC transporter substrate-binding protein n=1 Tax=Aquamicrobium defluvii TaxID=69279 RepID=A0A011TCB9_9HYPH|nr:zinc ABC transporter substrate-binding protein AztC [Aquamicrobium defluvii]EXL09284.1 metal ABC transporter substrate-binding protein [Aquamicrobium defluvii]EZQ15448.1 metal ABC transporter substrate-binding protein [Halopseudomonas bauzanensis]TDR36118.1 zinc/manganese transport system substrate-binding protein [Aquamicrobium defluvii]